jgi:glycosyltransferase involved in cell wall biosynthesis
MLNNEFPPLGGGTGTVNRVILQRFAQAPDLEIDLVTSALGRRYEQERFADRIQIFKVPVNNRIIHHSSKRELITYSLHALPFALKRQRHQKYDLCLAWSAVPAGGVALALRRLTGLRYIVRVCGPDIPGHERRYGMLYPVLTPLIRAAWRGSETVVAKCREEVDKIRKVDRQTKITLIPNGVDLTMFPPGLPIPDGGPFRILCVGRQIEHKGQRYLIEAVKKLTEKGVEVELDLVGTGDAEPDNQVLAKQLKVADRVHFPGYVPREEIHRYYASAHVFALPSYNEGMSVATLEAMAAGLPIVITRTGGTSDLVEDGVNGLIFDWPDVETLTAHLQRLALNRALARQLGAASRARAAMFTWEAATQRYLELFEVLTPHSHEGGVG